MRHNWTGRIVFHPEYGIGKVIGSDPYGLYDVFFYKANSALHYDISQHIYWAWPEEIEGRFINANTLRCIIKRRRQCK